MLERVRVRPTVAAAVALLAACSDTPAAPPASEVQAAAAVLSNGWRPVTLVVQKCGSPVVVVTGEWHEVFRLQFDQNGGLHRGYHVNFRLKGESADGKLYAYSGVQSSNLYFANPPVTDMTELRLRFIAQGDYEDMIQIFRYHLTITPSGEVTTLLEAESEECGQGGSGETPG